MPEFYLDYWVDRIRRLLESSVRDRPLLDGQRAHDVFFHEFVGDDMTTVERIYDVAGLVMTDRARGQITAYRDAHRRGSEGRVVYDLRGAFETTPDDVRAAFGFYFDRFPVAVEVA